MNVNDSFALGVVVGALVAGTVTIGLSIPLQKEAVRLQQRVLEVEEQAAELWEKIYYENEEICAQEWSV